MHKHLIRLLLGAALLFASSEFMRYGWAYLDLSTAGPLKKNHPLQEAPPSGGDEDFFDRPDPAEFIKTDESKQFQAAGFLRLRAGQLCFIVGSILVMLGSLSIVGPPVLRFLSWLIVPDSVRRKLAETQPQPEAPPCTTAAS